MPVAISISNRTIIATLHNHWLAPASVFIQFYLVVIIIHLEITLPRRLVSVLYKIIVWNSVGISVLKAA